MSTTIVPVVGVTFAAGYPANLHMLRDVYSAHREEGISAVLVRNPGNEYDANAIEVHVPALGGLAMIGHIGRRHAARLAPLIDAGERFVASIHMVRVQAAHEDRPGIDVAIRHVGPDGE